MKKAIVVISNLLILTTGAQAEVAAKVDLDQRGDRIEQRLDNKGDRREERLDKNASTLITV